MKYSEIVFWGGYPTSHILPLLTSLNKKIKTIYISVEKQDDKIINRYTEIFSDNIIYIRNKEELDLTVGKYADEKYFNIFSSYLNSTNIQIILKFFLQKNIKVNFYSEVRDFKGVSGFFRYVHSLYFEKKFNRNIQLLFGIGRYSSAWFSKIGYDKNIVVKSAYYINSNNILRKIPTNNNHSIKIIYLGRYVKSKGLVNFLRSIIDSINLIQNKIEIHFYGSGPLASLLDAYSKSNLSGLIKVHGEINYNEVCEKISQYDYLILPSNDYSDGWGVVVSEALSVGVPVIVSKYAGSSMMITNYNGYVYDPDNRFSLINIFNKIICNSDIHDSNHIKKYFNERYSATSGAEKIYSIIDML